MSGLSLQNGFRLQRVPGHLALQAAFVGLLLPGILLTSEICLPQVAPAVRGTGETIATDPGLKIPCGFWQFPGIPWMFSQSEPAPLSGLVFPEIPKGLPGGSVELDNHLLTLIRTLMNPDHSESELQWYSIQSAELNAQAATVTVNDIEIPVAFSLCWPAGEEKWTQLCAWRLPSQLPPTPLLTLPPGCQITANQLSSDGSVQCHLVKSIDSEAQLKAWLKADAWALEEPDESTGVTGLFRIRSSRGRFEFSVREGLVPAGTGDTGGDGIVLLIRPI